MKRLTLIMAPLLIVIGLQANSKKINEDTIKTHKIENGTTLRSYSKPGAPIDMEYNTTRVDINQTCDVNISLVTSIQTGTLEVQLHLDDNLTTINSIEENLSFNIQPDAQNFLINFQVKSKHNGLFYIRMLTKIDKGYGPKLRSFAVPVYIGEKPKVLLKRISPQMKALSNGENISVSKAVETIEVIQKND